MHQPPGPSPIKWRKIIAGIGVFVITWLISVIITNSAIRPELPEDLKWTTTAFNLVFAAIVTWVVVRQIDSDTF